MIAAYHSLLEVICVPLAVTVVSSFTIYFPSLSLSPPLSLPLSLSPSLSCTIGLYMTGPSEYCSGRHRCECVRGGEGQCLQFNATCTSDEQCTGDLGEFAVCVLGRCTCDPNRSSRLNAQGKCVKDIKGWLSLIFHDLCK